MAYGAATEAPAGLATALLDPDTPVDGVTVTKLNDEARRGWAGEFIAAGDTRRHGESAAGDSIRSHPPALQPGHPFAVEKRMEARGPLKAQVR